jgi:hypothetical protein
VVGGPFASAKILNCILIRQSGTPYIIGWQHYAYASGGFVLRDRIIAVRNVQMDGHELTSVTPAWSHSTLLPVLLSSFKLGHSIYSLHDISHERGAGELRSETIPVGLV